MDFPVDDDGKSLIEDLVRQGRYASATDVVEEGLRLLAEREAKFTALREHVQRAIAEGGRFTGADVEASVETALDEWERQQFKT